MLWLINRQLKSSNLETRRQAAEQLCRARDPRAFDSLKAALSDSDSVVRQFAATALGQLDDDRIVEPLLNALQDREPEVVKAVIAALKSRSDPKIITAIVPFLRHSDASVRDNAVQALDQFDWRPTSKEDQLWQLVAKGQFSRVAAYGESAIPVLESVIDSSPSATKAKAIKALVGFESPRAMSLLLSALQSTDPAACIAAAGALATTAEDVVQPIAALLGNPDSHVRVAAIEALYTMRASATYEQIRALLPDPEWEVRRQAAETLGRLKDKQSSEALTQALTDSDADVREAVVISLGQLGDRSAIGPLVLALKDKNSSVRRMAAVSLARIDDDWSSSPAAEAAFEKLKAGLDKEDSDVRDFVSELLISVGVIKPKESPAQDGTNFISSPESRRKVTMTQFISMLADADPDFRHAAAHALGSLDCDEAAQIALMNALADPDPAVRSAVEKALHQFAVRTER